MLRKIIILTAVILAVFNGVGMAAANVFDEPAKKFVQKYNAIARKHKSLELNENIQLLKEDGGYKMYGTRSKPETLIMATFMTRSGKNIEHMMISSPDLDLIAAATWFTVQALGFKEDEFKSFEAQANSGANPIQIFSKSKKRTFFLGVR